MTSPSDRVEDGAVGPATKIIGTEGTITIPSPSYRPVEFTVHKDDIVTKYRFPIPVNILAPQIMYASNSFQGHGMFWEADSVARSLAKGEMENSLMPHNETLEVLKVMDRVREIGQLKYPDEIEAVS